jgi:nitrite reductase/ring-hydroxylating ferredoxin subunit
MWKVSPISATEVAEALHDEMLSRKASVLNPDKSGAPTEPPSTTETVVTELLNSIPENTSVVLTVDNEIVPLVTTEATDLILVGDPIWCPAGVLPDPSVNGCTDSYPDLESLLDDIDNAVIPEPSEDGTIWIMAGNDASTLDLDIDGSIFTNWSSYSLTLQGGWDGGTSGTITSNSTFNVSLSITNWNNTVTLNQIIIDGANVTGLDISTDGDIVLEDVTSSNNDGYGAELSAGGNITLNGDNAFNNNINSGLYAEADGNINSENITASDNGEYGAEFYSLNDIILTGDNTFNNNGRAVEALLVNYQGDFFAYVNRCPHIGISLDWVDNQFFTVDSRYLMCANHGATFEPATGECIWGPCVGAALQSVPLEIDGEYIFAGSRNGDAKD